MWFRLISENVTQRYSQKLFALASPLHMFFLLSWSGVVPITAMQPLLKSTKTPSKSQYTFRDGEEEEALRRLESPPRANDGLSDIGYGQRAFPYTYTRPIIPGMAAVLQQYTRGPRWYSTQHLFYSIDVSTKSEFS